jgi:hypothetical protein
MSRAARVNGRIKMRAVAYLLQIGCFRPMSSHVCCDEVQELYRYLSATLPMLRYQSLSVEEDLRLQGVRRER